MIPPALVLAAGLGTRARPLTLVRAKPALPIAGQPLIERILHWLATAGAPEALVNLHYLPETVAAAVGDGEGLGIRVRYSWEQPILGSAGGIRRAFGLVDTDELAVVNGDTLTDVKLDALADAHRGSAALVTMAVIPNPDPAAYGGVVVADDGRVERFTRRGDPAGRWHFVGAQMVRHAAIARLEDGVAEESVGHLYPALIQEDPDSVRAFRTDATFLDIGTPRSYLATCLAVAQSPADLAGTRCRVAPDARVDRSVLWDDVTIGSGAVLSDCIVGNGVAVAPGARYHASVLLRAGDAPGAGGTLTGDLLVAPLAAPAAGAPERQAR